MDGFYVEPTTCTTLRTLETLYFGRRCSIATVYCLHMNTMYILDSNGALSLSLSLFFFPSSHCMHIHIQMRAMEEWDIIQKLDENTAHSDPQNGKKEKQ